jgi:hypothetical protein
MQSVPKEKWSVEPKTTFFFLTVKSEPYYKVCGKAGRVQYVDCECVCGKIKSCQCAHLKAFRIRSCGCKRGEFKRRYGTLLLNHHKTCSYCCKEQHESEFAKHNRRQDGLQDICNTCKSNISLVNKYGLSKQDFLELLRKQNNACACCHTSFDKHKICVDHDHSMNIVRGLLCNKCNCGIGLLGDSITSVKQAVRYLESYINEQRKRIDPGS